MMHYVRTALNHTYRFGVALADFPYSFTDEALAAPLCSLVTDFVTH